MPIFGEDKVQQTITQRRNSVKLHLLNQKLQLVTPSISKEQTKTYSNLIEETLRKGVKPAQS